MSTMSAEESGMRHRHRGRSNTITSYHAPERPNWQPGAEPGIDTSADSEILSQLKAKCDINIFDFSIEDVQHTKATNETLAACIEQPRDGTCRWISVNGLSGDVIKCLGNKYSLHSLAIEDLIHTHTRTKVDWYADHAFVLLTLQKLVRLHQHKGIAGKCDCLATENYELDEKLEHVRSYPKLSPRSWWQWGREKQSALPRYMDQNMDGKIDEFVQAHSGVSEDSPIKPIRTLHRYESAQIPEHTAFMEKHSVLASEDLAVSVEQVSIFLLDDNTVISFFENSATDVEVPILERLQSTETMLRRSCDASLMLQAIIDAIVDLAVPVKDAYNKMRKELQVDAMTNPDIRTSRALHIFGEEIDMLQNLFKPIVHLVNALRDHNSEPTPSPLVSLPVHQEHDEKNQPKKEAKRDRDGAPTFKRNITEIRKSALRRGEPATSVTITPLAHTYFGDVLDHCITMIQALEQMDASASNISTLIFNTVGAKTNNFMMILAVVTVFFAPLTFISGYFGMNFASGAGLAHSFGFFWVIAIPSLVAFMLIVFATMLWDNITDFFAKRGIRAVRRNRRYGQ
ncbi:hypothetical protein LTR36_008396 [Oleoguttula mirabilis]|uniref:Uncharacterized protein n=1 Tax=Oleoguttula mirabilis TaxID=1507867 RepID=A0AAV9J7P9_9PEZI|nr:hypothetical protein LTR36_008396 [Oleoguttula mirabilis]